MKKLVSLNNLQKVPLKADLIPNNNVQGRRQSFFGLTEVLKNWSWANRNNIIPYINWLTSNLEFYEMASVNLELISNDNRTQPVNTIASYSDYGFTQFNTNGTLIINNDTPLVLTATQLWVYKIWFRFEIELIQWVHWFRASIYDWSGSEVLFHEEIAPTSGVMDLAKSFSKKSVYAEILYNVFPPWDSFNFVLAIDTNNWLWINGDWTIIADKTQRGLQFISPN